MERDEAFEELRPLLRSIAYRMLGSVADAEDVVQEAYLRWRGAADVRDAKAYLSTTVTRLSIDHLRSARVRRERYVGPWLPEPLLGTEPDASEAAEISDSLSMAFLLVLENLTPTERAAFLLREVFDYPYEAVAETLGTSEANARQLVHRAKERMRERRTRFEADRVKQRELLGLFLAACARGEVEPLIEMLAEDAVLYSDGGGVVTAARVPIHGPRRIATFLTRITRGVPPDVEWHAEDVNGQLGMVARRDGRPWTVLTADVADGRLQTIYIVVNPEKLAALD